MIIECKFNYNHWQPAIYYLSDKESLTLSTRIQTAENVSSDEASSIICGIQDYYGKQVRVTLLED